MAVPFRVTERSTIVGRQEPPIADGSYKVLATLIAGDKTYRLTSELMVRNGNAQLRLHRFGVADSDQWYADRKVVIPLPDAELAPLDHRLKDVEFMLRAPVALDDETAGKVFGPNGPPEV